MKRLYFPALCLAFGLLLSSCAESVEPSENQKTQSVKERRELLTKSITERLAAGVTQSDVEDYLVYRLNIPLTDVKDITRYGIDTDTLFSLSILGREDGTYSLVITQRLRSLPIV